MSACKHKTQVLPDLEMYGGDTTSWAVTFEAPSFAAAAFEDLSAFTCILTLSPYRSPMAAAMIAKAPEIVVRKTVELTRSATSGEITALFEFLIDDTCCLFGKYTYQIEITNGDELYLAQGTLVIKPYVHKE